ncbi:MAG: alpha/beta fold hydrolase [Deltaproteobacteria bacterium]|nr:alpha/beta fold hydrolase [Deltaproteobacteria bacterium]
MIPAEETFDGTFPFVPHFSIKPGFRMHYVDEGEGEPIVCLHGEPTWGYLYRNFIPPLARTHRVIVPDYMGFGKSETPQDREYTFRAHVDNLEVLLNELDLHDITFVLQDWGGPIGGAYSLRNLSRVKRVFLLNTVLPIPAPGTEERMTRVFESRWFKWMNARQEDGSFLEVLGNLGSTVLSVMKIIGFEKSAVVDDTWIRAYSAPFATREECKGAIAFPYEVVTGKAGLFEVGEPAEIEAFTQKPVMLAEGMRDHAIPPEVAIEQLRAQFPHAPIVELTQAGHFTPEDEPATLVALIQQFIKMT